MKNEATAVPDPVDVLASISQHLALRAARLIECGEYAKASRALTRALCEIDAAVFIADQTKRGGQ